MALAHLIASLLFIGFFSPVCRVTALSANKKSNERFISLRDYDFVGEDPRLKAALAERMKVLQGEVDLSDQKTSQRVPAASDMHWGAPAFETKPDYLHSSLKYPQLVNVSLDYAELYNASELFPEMNASWHPPGRRRPGLRGDTNPFPGHGGRRHPQYENDPSQYRINEKILLLMTQLIYGAQRQMAKLDVLIAKYETDPRFRMAYMYHRLDEWLLNLRNVYRTVRVRNRNNMTRVKRIIFYYEYALRNNIDITYTIEDLVFVHTEYMKAMDVLIPADTRQRLRETKQMKKMLKENATNG